MYGNTLCVTVLFRRLFSCVCRGKLGPASVVNHRKPKRLNHKLNKTRSVVIASHWIANERFTQAVFFVLVCVCLHGLLVIVHVYSCENVRFGNNSLTPSATPTFKGWIVLRLYKTKFKWCKDKEQHAVAFILLAHCSLFYF